MQQPTLTLLERFRSIRQQTQQLCTPLHEEDYVVQPIADVSPPKWHLGHTTWFFETFLLIPYLKHYKVYHPDYAYVFNSYYESLGSRIIRTSRGNLTRPLVQEIYAYRTYVDQFIEKLLENNFSQEASQRMELGLQHEQQHQELLVTDIKYILGNNPLFPAYQSFPSYRPSAKLAFQPAYTEVPEGLYQIGYAGADFHFDNEKGTHQVFLHPFRVRNQLVTNGEYLEFIEDGGYRNFQHWLMEGLEWVKQHDIRAPLYWYDLEGEWYQYTVQGLRKLWADEPVTHISMYEASAFAQWRGQRLLTEFEWEAACQQTNATIPKEANFVETKHFHPVSGSATNNQFFGDTWEWTNSAYLPYPYYQRPTGALGEYNGKFMINQMVLRGGSCATPRDHIRTTYRNFFHPDKRWQFTGIRLGESI